MEELIKRGYESDPVKAWKSELDRAAALEGSADLDSEEEEESEENLVGKNYDYLLGKFGAFQYHAMFQMYIYIFQLILDKL